MAEITGNFSTSADMEGTKAVSPRPSPRLAILCVFLALAVAVALYARSAAPSLRRIGATAFVTELNTGVSLQARVDTGAVLCSIHCEEIEPPDDANGDELSIGKPIRFRILDNAGESHWIETKLVDVSSIRTSSETMQRFCVALPLRVDGVEAAVLVTLNYRRNMRYPFLIGRNLLRDRFVVDVSQNSDDVPASP